MITIYTIAEKANISAATVSRVFSNFKYVKPEIRKKVLSIAKQLNYTPNLQARSLRSHKTHIIGLLVPDISNPTYPIAIKGVYDLARENNYHISIGNTYNDPDEEIALLEMFKSIRVDGLIIMSQEYTESNKFNRIISEMIKNGVVCIFSGRENTGIKADQVMIDSKKGAYIATEYLIKTGCKKIAYLGGIKGIFGEEERYNGYKQALKDYNVHPDLSLVKHGNFNKESGYKMMSELLDLLSLRQKGVSGNQEVTTKQSRTKSHSEQSDLSQSLACPCGSILKESAGSFKKNFGEESFVTVKVREQSLPDAVFCVNDLTALGAMKAIEEKGLKIPDDISIIGFDDIPEASLVKPSLTTVSQPQYEIGKKCMKRLLERINGKKDEPVQTILFEPELIIRQTTKEIQACL